MNIYTFVGIVAIVVFTIAGIAFLAQKYLEFAAYAVEQANIRAERAYQALLEKKRAEEKEACKKCLEEFYD